MRFSTPTPLLLPICFALFTTSGAWAQPAPRATPAQKGDAPLTPSSFTAKGLHREDDLNDLFVGNFADVTFDRGSLVFSQLFEMYLEAYSNRCSASLPRNKVEMTTQVCAEEPASPPLPGEPPPQPHPCMSWRTVSLGFAKPDLYAAKRRFDAEQAVNQFKDMVGSIKNLMRPAVEVAQVAADTDALVQLNACAGPGLKRFEDNLVLFSMGKPPLLLPGAQPPTSTALPPGALIDSDYNRLVDDLVAEQSTTWTFNRYVPGSISQMLVAHDPTGRPSMIRAKYFFTSPAKSGRTQGSVNVSFTDGMPTCIYFSDAPSDCRPPNRRIVAKYLSGAYLDPNARPSAESAAAEAAATAARAADQAKARAEASVRGNICVPDDLLAEWRNPPPGGKMEALQRTLKASLRERATLSHFDQTKWMTVYSKGYSTWNPTAPFRGVVAATDGGSCAAGNHEFLALNP